MILSRRKIISQNLVQYILDRNYQISKYGVFFTLNRVFAYTSSGIIDFDNTFQELPYLKEIDFDEDFTLHLKQGVYCIEFNERVALPPNLVGMLQARKALLRAGASVEGHILPPGYSGQVSCLLNVHNPMGLKVTKHARLGQWIFMEME
jgi:deoxycytidine triphosphate deaminase